MADIIEVPARAKVYASQTANGSGGGITLGSLFFGQAYHYRGALDPAVDPDQFLPDDPTTRVNVAVWDAAAEGQAAARVETRPLLNVVGDGTEEVAWFTNVAYTWDLEAIQDEYGPLNASQPIEITFTVSDFELDAIDPTQLRIMFGRRLVDPEDAAPDHTFFELSPTFTYYYEPSSAWRDPGASTATSPSAMAADDADVPSPSTYFAGWSTLMDPGNGVPGQVPKIPQLPIEPLGIFHDDADPAISPAFQLADVIPVATSGAITVPVTASDADSGRWLMLWLGVQSDYDTRYVSPPGSGTTGWFDLSLEASFTYTTGATVTPPLQQAARIFGVNNLQQQAKKESRSLLLTARGRF